MTDCYMNSEQNIHEYYFSHHHSALCYYDCADIVTVDIAV